jgi:hypothetical protein
MTTLNTLTTKLPALLAKLDRPGDYYGTGTTELPVVRVAVDGVGLLGLPIPRMQAEALRAAAHEAPYGRGPETILDANVRRCGQFDASEVHANDPRWVLTLGRIVRDAARALGVDGEVQAELYKLLVYGPGDFFVAHRDTEKAPGMFATLVVALPSPHDGGALTIRHEGREATVSLAGDDLGVARWAAFYCDCLHELAPLREGYRVALTYNLTRRAKEPVRAPDASPVVAKLAALLRGWTALSDAPHKLVIPLAHQYTAAELGFATLKNHDAAAAQALARAAREADCVVHLAMLSIRESGAAEPNWDGYSRSRRGDDGSEYEVVEVNERVCTLEAWRSLDGSAEDLGPVTVDEEEEIAPPGSLEDAEPDEDHLTEAMGNGGASFERTYRYAALVVWPRAYELLVAMQGGADGALAALERYARESPDRARSLAVQIIDGWAGLRPHYLAEAGLRHVRALRVIGALGDPSLTARFLRAVAATGGVAESEADVVVSALARLPLEDARRTAVELAKSALARPFAVTAKVVRSVAEERRDGAMRDAIEAFAGSLAAWPEVNGWPQPPLAERVRGLVDLFCAGSVTGDEAVVTLLAKRVAEERRGCPLDEVVVPCALALREEPAKPAKAAVAPMVVACVEHLTARCALPLIRPPDAARETDGLACECADCAELRTFLCDPKATTWRLKAAQQRRSHVEHEAARARTDIAMHTERHGNPHALVCVKTTARYDARVRQREADKRALAAFATW